MCGIHAVIGSTDSLRRMAVSTRHRGADAEGLWTGNGLGLAHNRLSILDLSEQANQPMWNADKTIGVVYNGEVYNHLELRSLISEYSFKTTSDTETLLALYEKEGIRFVDRLHGMFAFVILDTINKKIHAVRDPDGIKPLVYTRRNKGWAFASEIVSLAEWQKPDAIDPEGLLWYLSTGFVPAPRTFFSNIHSLIPGQILTVSTDDGSYTQDRIQRASEPLLEIGEALEHGLRRHLLSDVPVGLFLSGGIDSSLMAAILVKDLGIRPSSFHISIPNRPDTANAELVARHLGLQMESVPWSKQDESFYLEEAVSTLGQPLADVAFLPALKVSKLAAQSVKVVLSGDGADELFLGYGRHSFLAGRRLFRQKKFIRQIESRKLRAAFSRLIDPVSAYFDALRLSDLSIYPSSSSLESIISERKITKGEDLDDKLYLPDDLMVKTDLAGMRYGLEARLPYLDPLVRAAAKALAEPKKRSGKTGKVVLREMLDGYGLRSISQQGKQGFGISVRGILESNAPWFESHAAAFLKREEVGRLLKFESKPDFARKSPVLGYALALAEAVSRKWGI